MHYLYVAYVSHTYHIRLCELDHDLGSVDVKLRLWLKLYGICSGRPLGIFAH